MRTKIARTALLAGLLSLGACGGGGDPLIGTWTFDGSVPATVHTMWSLKADKTFTLVETVAPATFPAGTSASSCVTSDALEGTFEADGSRLSWMLVRGTVNIVSGCEVASTNSPGRPTTDAEVTDFIQQGEFPPRMTSYQVDATKLVLTTSTGFSRNFTKSH